MSNAASTAIDWSEQGLVPDTVIRHGVKRLLKKRIGELHTNDCENLADSKAAVFRCMHESAISPGWDARVRPSLVRVRTDCRHTSPPLLTWISTASGRSSFQSCPWPGSSRANLQRHAASRHGANIVNQTPGNAPTTEKYRLLVTAQLQEKTHDNFDTRPDFHE